MMAPSAEKWRRPRPHRASPLYYAPINVKGAIIFALNSLGGYLAVVAQQPNVGDEVCTTGYIMDQFCIDLGYLLDDSSVTTLANPEKHSFHCLLDVPVCKDSGYVVLSPEKDEATGLYTLGFRLDDTDTVLQAGLAAGRQGMCSDCTGDDTKPEYGYRATIKGTVKELGDGTDGIEGTPVLENIKVLGDDISCEVASDNLEDSDEPEDAPVAENCNFCPDGVDEEHILAFSGGDDAFAAETLNQCQQDIENYKAYDADSDMCIEALEVYSQMCCPILPDNPCAICPDGINEEHILTSSGGDEALAAETLNQCQQIIKNYELFEADSDICIYTVRETEYTQSCCPSPPNTPCAICPDGFNEEHILTSSGGDEALAAENLIYCQNYNETYEAYEADTDTCNQGLYMHTQACCPTPLENPCSICPGGITISQDSSLLGPDQDPLERCQDTVESAKAHDEGSDICESIKSSEIMCCPTLADNPCSICPNGVNVTEVSSLFGLDDTNATDTLATCQQTIESSKMIEADSDMCELAKMSEMMCCPTPTKNPCSFCADGISVTEDSFPNLGDSNGTDIVTSCQQTLEMSKMIEADSDMCELAKLSEVMCCPSANATGGCSFCPDGITADEGSLAFYGEDMLRTCQDTIATSMILPPDMCDSLKEIEMICCPTMSGNPCTICPGGVDEDHVEKMSFGNETYAAELVANCQQLIEHYKLFDADDATCSEIAEYTEMSCCPTPAENPCFICPGGVTANEDNLLLLDLNETEVADIISHCQSSIMYYEMFNADSDTCKEGEINRMTCCPSPIEDPCSLCPNGLTADIDLIIADDMTCGQVIEYAMIFEANSESCPYYRFYEIICCPTQAVIPCSICPDAVVMNESPDDSLNLTCSEIASNVEEGSTQCGLVKVEWETHCCGSSSITSTMAGGLTTTVSDEMTSTEVPTLATEVPSTTTDATSMAETTSTEAMSTTTEVTGTTTTEAAEEAPTTTTTTEPSEESLDATTTTEPTEESLNTTTTTEATEEAPKATTSTKPTEEAHNATTTEPTAEATDAATTEAPPGGGPEGKGSPDRANDASKFCVHTSLVGSLLVLVLV